jgi:hypothetical protein
VNYRGRVTIHELTDLVFEFIAEGNGASTKGGNETPLLQWCAYYGDVSAIKFLLATI